MNPSLVILAAGMGSRYGGLKQLDPIGPNGETVLDYSVFDACRAGFAKVVVVIRKDFADRFHEEVGRLLENRIEVAYAYQELTDLPDDFRPPEGRVKPWGTAHAIWAARHTVAGPFAVINADDFYGAAAYRALVDFFQGSPQSAHPTPCALVGYRLENTLSQYGGVSRGVLDVTDDGFLAGIREMTDIRAGDGQPVAETPEGPEPLAPDTLVSMNCWGFQPALFEQFETRLRAFLQAGAGEKSELYVADPVESAIREKKATFRVLPNEGRWFGVTYREDKQRALSTIGELIESGEYPERLWT